MKLKARQIRLPRFSGSSESLWAVRLRAPRIRKIPKVTQEGSAQRKEAQDRFPVSFSALQQRGLFAQRPRCLGEMAAQESFITGGKTRGAKAIAISPRLIPADEVMKPRAGPVTIKRVFNRPLPVPYG